MARAQVGAVCEDEDILGLGRLCLGNQDEKSSCRCSQSKNCMRSVVEKEKEIRIQ